MTRRQRIVLCEIAAVLALPVALLLGLAALSRVLYPWPDPVPGVRLEPLRPPLPAEQIGPDNAFFYLRQLTQIRRNSATEAYDDELLGFRDIGWETGRYPACVQCLAELGPNRNLFAQAAAVSTARAAVTHWDSPIIWQYGCRDTARLLAVDAERAAGENRWDDAADDIRITLRNAVHLTRGGDFSYPVRLVATQATQSVRRLALEGNPPPAWLREMVRCLRDADRRMYPWSEQVRHDRLLYLEFPDLVFSNLAGLPRAVRLGFRPWESAGPTAPPLTPRDQYLGMGIEMLLPVSGSSPERSQRHLDAVFSHYLSLLESEEGEKAAPYSLLHMPRDDSWTYWLWLLNDPVGRVIASRMEVSSMGGALTYRRDEWLESTARLRAATLTCAIRLCQTEHEGKLPETLAALTPQYLARLPDDPFAPGGTPFGYRVNPDGTFVLWSRGPDRIDHGGRYRMGLPPIPGIEGHMKECDLVFASDDFLKLRAYCVDEARKRAEHEAWRTAAPDSRNPMPGKQ